MTGVPSIATLIARRAACACALALLAVVLLLAAPPVAGQSLSSNANLSSLSILGTDVAGFNAGTTSYTLDLDAPEGPATVAAVAADTGASVAYSPADADSDTAGHQAVLNEGRNTVSVTVTAEDGTTRKTYTVTVNVSDALDSAGTTALATVDPGGRNNAAIQYRGSVRSAGDEDWIRVGLEAGQMYRFALKGSYRSASRTLDVPIIAGLYDKDGNYIDGTFDVATICDHRGEQCNARMHYLPPAGTGGDHYLRVRGFDDQSGTYALRVLAVPDDTQPDNASTSGEIAVGASVAATINYHGDVDWFQATLEAGAQYVATIQRRSSDWPLTLPSVSVYDANVEQVAVSYQDSTRRQAIFTAAEDGAYYVAAQGRFGRTGRYTLGLRFSSFAITGATVVGQTLIAETSGIADADGVTNASYSYQWIRVDGDTETDIGGATGRTYTLTEDDVGKSIRVRATFRDDAGKDETRVSAVTGPVRVAVTVSWGSSSYTAVERAPGVTVTVKLSADPKAPLTVPIKVERQDGAGTADYSGVPDSVTFDSNSQTDGSDRPFETFTVTAQQDGDHDDESISLSFGTLPVGVTAGSQAAATVELHDLVREVPDHWLLVPEGLGAGGGGRRRVPAVVRHLRQTQPRLVRHRRLQHLRAERRIQWTCTGPGPQ